MQKPRYYVATHANSEDAYIREMIEYSVDPAVLYDDVTYNGWPTVLLRAWLETWAQDSFATEAAAEQEASEHGPHAQVYAIWLDDLRPYYEQYLREYLEETGQTA